jgi:hypothetical protein
MKAMKKTVGKKPMMKAKKGMSVKDPGDGALGKLSAKFAGAFGTGVAALSAAVQARKEKKAKQAAEEKAKMEAEGTMKYGGAKKMYGGKTMKSGGTKKK